MKLREMTTLTQICLIAPQVSSANQALLLATRTPSKLESMGLVLSVITAKPQQLTQHLAQLELSRCRRERSTKITAWFALQASFATWKVWLSHPAQLLAESELPTELLRLRNAVLTIVTTARLGHMWLFSVTRATIRTFRARVIVKNARLVRIVLMERSRTAQQVISVLEIFILYLFSFLN